MKAHFRAPVVLAAQKVSTSAPEVVKFTREVRRDLGVAEKHATSEFYISVTLLRLRNSISAQTGPNPSHTPCGALRKHKCGMTSTAYSNRPRNGTRFQ